MFFQNAFKGENEWWKWLLIPFLSFFGYVFGQIPLAIGVFYYAAKNNLSEKYTQDEVADLLNSLDFAAIGMDSNVAIFLMLLMFVCMAAVLVLFVQVLHKRSWKTLITPLEMINWRKIGFSFLLWAGFSLALEIVSYLSDPSSYTLTFNLFRFLPLLLIVLLLMPIQTTTEELLFRGYLMQGLGRLSGSKIVALIITSILFGLMHIMNPEVKEFGMGIMMTYYISVGIFLGLLTIMDDSLELAIGVHAATNMFSALFVSYEGGALQTDAIFRTEVVNVGLMLPVFLVVATVFFIICWRKYRWEGWSRLLEPVIPPAPPPLPNIEVSDTSSSVDV
jgi:membrane protease YdiL (CAAX protease family)